MTTGSLLLSAVTPHTPRMAVEEKAPPFLRGVIDGSPELGRAVRSAAPDLLIVQSTHWVTSFTWYATCHARHRGHCVADEAPDMIPGLPYDRPGDPGFADALVEALAADGLQAGRNISSHFHWDYGSYVPLRYVDPEQTIPAVLIGSCLLADLDECLRVGRIIRETVERTGRRAVFLGSTALAHRILRGPELWPPEEHRAADRDFIEKLCAGRIAEARAGLPSYAKRVVAEMGGRTLATFLGTLEPVEDRRYAGRQFGAYGQSSGSGNASVAVWTAD